MSETLPPENPAPTPKKKKGPGGRPTKLTPELQKKAVKAAESLCTEATLCDHIGIDQDTLVNWKHRARIGEKAYKEFFRQLDMARAGGRIKHYTHIGKSKEWRASAWLIERSEGATAQRIEHSGKGDKPIQVEQTGVTPPVYLILQGAEGLHNPYEPTAEPEPGP